MVSDELDTGGMIEILNVITKSIRSTQVSPIISVARIYPEQSPL